MKKFILSMTMLVLVLCLKTNISNAAEISAMERLDYWDVSKEYTITNQDATYHAYLSKDKKESWIFKADVAKDKKNVKVVIPDKIENAPVVIVGATSGYDEILAKQNLGSVGIQGPDGSYYLDAEVTLWGDLLEPWHCPGPYIKNIKSITMPDTVRYLGVAAFAYTTSVETIRLSNQLVSLREYTFLECKNLKKIDASAKVKVEAKEAFTGSSKLTNFTDIGSFRCLTISIGVHLRIEYHYVYVLAGCKYMIQTTKSDIICTTVKNKDTYGILSEVIFLLNCSLCIRASGCCCLL